MKRKLWTLLVIGFSGCSTSPVVDVLDFTFPTNTDLNYSTYTGGVQPAPVTEVPLPVQPPIVPAPADVEFSELP